MAHAALVSPNVSLRLRRWRREGLEGYARRVAVPAIPSLSASQLSALAALGEELTAGVGDVERCASDA